MGWKEFFKPDKFKIIIFIILFTIGIIVGLTYLSKSFCKCTDNTCSNCPKTSMLEWIVWLIALWPGTLFFTNLGYFWGYGKLLILPALVIYYYLLSCIIISLINKFKK